MRHSVTAASSSSSSSAASTDTLARDVAAAQAMAAADPYEEGEIQKAPSMPPTLASSTTPEPTSPAPAHPSETPHTSDAVSTTTYASQDALALSYPVVTQAKSPNGVLISSSSSALDLDQAVSEPDCLKEPPLLKSSTVRQGEDEVPHSCLICAFF